MSVIILAIESSCDETSAALIKDGEVLSNVIATQDVHKEFGGVVPELASRAHQQNIVPVVEKALNDANIKKSELSAIAFTRGPGLLGALIVGTSFAKALALGLEIPLIEVNHMQAHILSHFIEEPKPQFPFLCLTVSGGHTQIVLVKDFLNMKVIGETKDDAAGEAFDKSAKLLGLDYPGGPMIDNYAKKGDGKRFKFSKSKVPGYDYSFSGIKTSILYFLKNEIKNIKVSDIESKGVNDFVTYVDKTSENRLVSELRKILPEAGFIAEENSKLKKQINYNWIIDPLDGTTNYIHGLPVYSISIALLKGEEILSGVVYEINQQECFYAWQNGGAYLNGHKIQTSNVKKLGDSLLATGFPYREFDKLDQYIDLFKEFMKDTHGIRRLGSAAVDLAYVACGRFDGFYEYGLHPWDVAAGALIIEQAGGVIGDFSGSKNYIFGKEIIGSNPFIFEQFLKIVQKHF